MIFLDNLAGTPLNLYLHLTFGLSITIFDLVLLLPISLIPHVSLCSHPPCSSISPLSLGLLCSWGSEIYISQDQTVVSPPQTNPIGRSNCNPLIFAVIVPPEVKISDDSHSYHNMMLTLIPLNIYNSNYPPIVDNTLNIVHLPHTHQNNHQSLEYSEIQQFLMCSLQRLISPLPSLLRKLCLKHYIIQSTINVLNLLLQRIYILMFQMLISSIMHINSESNQMI